MLGPLLFLIYINDLHFAIKYSTTHHFADDTNFLYVSKSLKKIQKYMNLDLRFVCNWLKANKISLNASKTEMLVFRDPRRKINFDLKIKIDGQKITPSKFVKYLGIYLGIYFLSWQIFYFLSMCKYYCDLHLTDNKAEIYCSMLSDYYRVIISR